jgi:competence CoiA-like predicted nuclease
MPFIGKHAKTGERVDIWGVEHPREVFALGAVVCPLCDGAMYVKDGMVRIRHFAHQTRCASPLAMPESIDHLLGKCYIAEHLRLDLAGHVRAKVEYEVPLLEAGRVADVLVTLPDGWRVAHECQLSGITTGELQERTEAYGRAGIDVFWWLGGHAATEENLSERVWQCRVVMS